MRVVVLLAANYVPFKVKLNFFDRTSNSLIVRSTFLKALSKNVIHLISAIPKLKKIESCENLSFEKLIELCGSENESDIIDYIEN